MKTTLGWLRRVLCEAYEAASYKCQLEQIIKRHAAPHVYLRFDDREAFSKARSFRFDINPNDHSNHAGLWTYMIEPGSKFLGEATFGLSSQWVTILKARDPKKLLRSDRYSENDLAADIKLLERRYPRDKIQHAANSIVRRKQAMLDRYNKMKQDGEFNEHEKDLMSDLEKSLTPFEKIDAMALVLEKHANRRVRYREFYMNLGYAGIEDPNGIIDTNGWTAVHFDPKNLKIVKRYRLKDAFDPIKHDREEEEYWKNRRIPDDFDPSRPENDPEDPSHEPGFYYTADGERKVDPRRRN